MTSVSRKESFRYGFHLFAYWLVLVVFSAALVAGGAWIVREQVGAIGVNREGGLAAVGGFLAVLGGLVFGSGQVGLVYKLLADGVGAGVATGTRESAGQTAGSGTAQTGEAGEGETAQSTVESPGGAAGAAATDTTAEEATARVDGATTGGQGAAGRGGESEEDRPESPPDPRPREGHEAGAGDERAATAAGSREAGTDDGTDGDAATGGSRRPSVADPEPAGTTASEEVAATEREDVADHAGAGASDDTTAGSSQADQSATAGSGESEGPGATTGGADRRESPSDVASESALAEELGFEGGGGESADGPAPGDDPLASGRDSAGAGTDPGSGALEEGADGGDEGTGSLADALAEEGGDEEGDDDPVPEWTTGADHVDRADEDER